MQTKHDLEQDLHSSSLILEKVKKDRYAQNLYAAMCNMRWQYIGTDWALSAGDLSTLALGEPWSCSWRYSGGIVAELRSEGDYLDWYCSGIRGGDWGDGEEIPEYVSEGTVTEEIRADLATLGWHPHPWDTDNDIS